MKKIVIYGLICLFLSGCAVAGDAWFIGWGEKEEEFYPDGELKKRRMKCNTPFEDVMNASIINTK